MRQIKRQILFGISLLLFGLAFAHSCYGDTSRSLVESSWRYENGEIVSSLNASEDEGISTLSITDLPTGATAEGIDVSEHQKKLIGKLLRLLVSILPFFELASALLLSAADSTTNFKGISLSANA